MRNRRATIQNDSLISPCGRNHRLLTLLPTILNLCAPFAVIAQSVGDTVVVDRPAAVVDWEPENEIAKVNAGAQLRIEELRESTQEWYRVNVNGKSGWIRKEVAKSLDEGIKELTAAIERDHNADNYTARARLWHAKGEFEIARADYDEVIRLQPKWAQAYLFRGLLCVDKHELENAVADFNEALRLRPAYAHAYENRGWALKLKGDYARALADYDAALKCNPQSAWSYSARAWIRATCPKAEMRNGNKAVDDAQTALKLSRWKTYNNYSTLAAAFAEAGDFGQAIKNERKAIEVAPASQHSELEARLHLYEAHQPFRETAPTVKAAP